MENKIDILTYYQQLQKDMIDMQEQLHENIALPIFFYKYILSNKNHN